MFAVGVGAALLASAMFNIGLALQAFEARKTPKQHGLRLTLVALLLRRPLWILGLVLGVAGVAPQVYAFSLAPFAVVQTATCCCSTSGRATCTSTSVSLPISASR